MTRTNSEGVLERRCAGAVIGGRSGVGERLTDEHFTTHDNFNKDNANDFDGLQSYCIDCTRVYMEEYKRRTGEDYILQANSVEDEN